MKLWRMSAWVVGIILVSSMMAVSFGQDLEDIKNAGVLRHLGIPYAHFNSGQGDGLDVDLAREFAAYLGVKYEYVPTQWADIIGALTGTQVKPSNNDVVSMASVPIQGDMIANGFTVLAWREKVVSFSSPTFPTQIWLTAPADSPIVPIVPSGDIALDIAETRRKLDGKSIMGKSGTCLDLSLYDITQAGAEGVTFTGSLNDLAPALLQHEADTLLLDVPDALIALRSWPGQIKIIGPMSLPQNMAAAFRPTSPQLRAAFNAFLQQKRQDGGYAELVRQYYSDVFTYFPAFFDVSTTE